MSIYDSLNPQQKEGVLTTSGPVLLLAGAGSGKTRVLTHRIAYLIEEEGVNPWNILAITFTNKAAREMRERVDALVSFGSDDIWVSTFHSTCVRILRRHIELLGFKSSFTIYDSDDQKTLIREICKRLNIDPKQYPERSLLNTISKAKDELKTPSDFEKENQGDFRKQKVCQVYREYQKRLKENNALDFDDLLFKTVELFQFHPEILDKYQERFRYIMVDEYQDTNMVQFKFVSMLARKYRNLCVVGDDDQSIYKFRGANIYNILNFEKEYPDAVVIKLEQNYRSTKNILETANKVIARNAGRKEKALWTENETGEKISFSQYGTEYEEAEQIASKIGSFAEDGVSYQDMAILYRTNAQSRVLEEKLLLKDIPYKIVGGINFYQRKEIKDILSYLKVVDNGVDDLAARRIINVPKRGIGLASIEKVNTFALEEGISFFDAVCRADEIVSLGRGTKKMLDFAAMIGRLRKVLYEQGMTELFQAVLDETGYVEQLKLEGTDEANTRIENIDELLNKIVEYENSTDAPSLSELLEEIALVADIDSLDEDSERVVLMTLHSAKGLEFPYVFLAGMEEGVFPSYMTIISENEEDLEEERRLCYVGITRAKKRLFLSCAMRRMIRGQTQYNTVSRFISEMPKDLLEMENQKQKNEVISMSLAQAAGRKKMFHKKPYQQGSIQAPGNVELDYQVGDRVGHVKFGMGTVTEIRPGGRDYEVTVDFDKCGVKKMFASFAKLKKDTRNI
ncbi:MAG: DNA helicase PcrA [Lachnospiraceae bacterium]|nr:DNA helicase PcrA [Lachnospiraceae bacterium]